ncbi:hypothetical protein CTM84_03530, partial [Photobacterium kishitanii]
MKQSDDITTNAYNFGQLFSCGVDEKTAIYNMSFNIAELHSCGNLRFIAKIGYNPLSRDNVGFGIGWSLNLSHYDIHNKIVSLSDGKSFRIISAGANNVKCRYLKDDKDISIKLKNNCLLITHKDGTIEEFDSFGNISKLISPSGHWHKYQFQNNRLFSVIDTENKNLTFEYTSNGVSIYNSNSEVTCVCHISSSLLKRVIFGKENNINI